MSPCDGEAQPRNLCRYSETGTETWRVRDRGGARFSRQRDLRSAASPGWKLRRPFFPALCVLLLLFSGLQEPLASSPFCVTFCVMIHWL